LPGKILAVADLILPAVADDLIENAELVANAVPERGHFDRRERVHVTRRESAQPAIAEAGLFFLRKNLVQIVAEPAHRFARGANDLYQEARNRGHALSVVGVPKTIDNDVGFVSRTFGFFTAVEEAARVLDCAHTEARSVPGGIGLVKLMGRHAGFITAGAVVPGQDVNFALIPEVPFEPAAFLAALKQRMLLKSHAVIAVAEGAGQDLLAADASARDASGNVKLKDIGPFLREKIEAFFKAEGIPIVVRYFDPSYQVRSRPANSEDALLCDLFARHAVHAAMAGKTGVVIGLLHERFIHVPIELLATHTKRLDPASGWWRSVLATTGQPERFA
jgi:6-phosphofructokinase 1